MQDQVTNYILWIGITELIEQMMKKMADQVLVVVLAVTLALSFAPFHSLAVHRLAFDKILHNGVNGPRGNRVTPLRNFSAEFLEAHNKARAAVGVAPLKWSPSLAKSAVDIARSMIHGAQGCSSSLSLPKNISSYNMHRYPGAARTPKPEEVVNQWLEMKKYYNHANNSCENYISCNSYTQVVWRKSLELGCAQETYYRPTLWNLNQLNGITLCLYSPPGNVPGERPY